MPTEIDERVIGSLSERIASACRVLGGLGLTVSILGHVSARVPGTDTILVRARGPQEPGVKYTSRDIVIRVGLDGKILDPRADGLSAPQEIFIHTEIYKARSDIHSVVHVHPEMAVLFSICDRPLLPIYGGFEPFGLRFARNGVPLYDRTVLINTPELGRDLTAAMGNADVCLMRGHGITTAANSIEEAAVYAISLNQLAAMNYRAIQLGGARLVNEEDQRLLLDTLQQRKSEPGRPSAVVEAMWRYYVTATEAMPWTGQGA